VAPIDSAADREADRGTADAIAAAPASAGAGALPQSSFNEPEAAPSSPAAHDPIARDDHRHDGGNRHDDGGHDDGGRSIAGTLLVALLLLLAGAALGIWAAPQIAPRLPSGMASVADWLSPRDREVESRVAMIETEAARANEALQADLDALREDLAAAAANEGEGELENRVAEIESQLGEQIDALAGDISAIDTGQIRERMSQLESTVQGMSETMSNLRDQLAAAEAAGDDSAEIDAYRAEVAGLRGEMQAVAGQVGQLSNRIDEVAAQAQQQIEFARSQVAAIEAEAEEELSQAETEAALAQIRSSLESGAPYNEPVARLASNTSVSAALMNPAPEGVATLQELRETFPNAAGAAIRASIQAGSEGGLLDRLRGFAESQIASRSLEPREGSDPDAVLSRIEEALRQNNLSEALAEAEALSQPATDAMGEWLGIARTRQEAMESFEALQAELSATN
jgi:hypothetical protein